MGNVFSPSRMNYAACQCRWEGTFTASPILNNASPAVIRQGGALVSGYPFAISVGIRLLDTIVDQVPNRSQIAVAGMQALDMTTCAAHVEFIGPRLGEIAAPRRQSCAHFGTGLWH